MKKRWKRRLERIRKEIPLGPLLSHLGYLIEANAPYEQQFSCDLHGGVDRKPSARFYPHTNSTYCWACQKARTSVDYLVEKTGISFLEALQSLEKSADLPPLPEEDEVQEDPVDWGEYALEDHKDAKEILHRLLQAATEERDMRPQGIARLWEEYDRLCLLEEEGQDTAKSLNSLLEVTRTWMGYGTSN